ncbi:hypothetical protein D3C76_1023870 [compost metagenome]
MAIQYQRSVNTLGCGRQAQTLEQLPLVVLVLHARHQVRDVDDVNLCLVDKADHVGHGLVVATHGRQSSQQHRITPAECSTYSKIRVWVRRADKNHQARRVNLHHRPRQAVGLWLPVARALRILLDFRGAELAPGHYRQVLDAALPDPIRLQFGGRVAVTCADEHSRTAEQASLQQSLKDLALYIQPLFLGLDELDLLVLGLPAAPVTTRINGRDADALLRSPRTAKGVQQLQVVHLRNRVVRVGCLVARSTQSSDKVLQAVLEEGVCAHWLLTFASV